MPKAITRSRCILFRLENNNVSIDQYIKKSGCEYAQYLLNDVIEGYLYFSQPKTIPKKKQWIPGAVYELSTQLDVKLKYQSVPASSFKNYGSGFLGDPSSDVIATKVKSHKESHSDPPPFCLKEFLRDLTAYEVKLECGYTLLQSSVEAFLTPADELSDLLATYTSFELEFYPVDLNLIQSNYKEFISKLIDLQINNSPLL